MRYNTLYYRMSIAFFKIALLFFCSSCVETYTVAGRVVDQDGMAIQDVSISLAGSLQATRTAEDGTFTITCSMPGTFTVTAEKTGYVFVPHNASSKITFEQNDLIYNITGFDEATTPLTFIYDIQGAHHLSSRAGERVTNLFGVVTALRSQGFYIQNPVPDRDDATSEGIYIYTSSAPTVTTGAWVLVNGTVKEYYPGGYASNNLSITEMTNVAITTIGEGYSLPEPIVIGKGGRIPPATSICSDASGNVEESPFTPETDGIDFYESLEGMRVEVHDALVTGYVKYGEVPVVSDNGRYATLRTDRGGVSIGRNDFNPERIFIDADADILNASAIDGKTGDRFAGPVQGIIDYSFGNYKLLPNQDLPELFSSDLERETSDIKGDENTLTVASFNVMNFSAASNQAKIQDIAETIVSGLHCPDILALVEIQDNNGATDDTLTDASATYKALLAAIAEAGGSTTYDFRDIAPEDDADGGIPGGNIRVGFLYNTARLSFVDIPGGDAITSTAVIEKNGTVDITCSPGRIDPENTAFKDSRKSLVGKFIYNGQPLYLIANHFKSKGEDDYLFGRTQPPVLTTEAIRKQQAAALHAFIESIVTIEPEAKVVVLGDFNDFQFSDSLQILKGENNPILTNLIESLPLHEQYTYIYEGNSQSLDHILVTNNIINSNPQFDIVHRYAEYNYNERFTDHDPLLASIKIPATGNDTTPASWYAGYPRVEYTTSTPSLEVKINEEGTVYYILLEEGSDIPTAGQIIDGCDAHNNPVLRKGSQTVSAHTAVTIPLPEIRKDINYKIYAVAIDNSKNVQQSPLYCALKETSSSTGAKEKDLSGWYVELCQNIDYRVIRYDLSGTYPAGSYIALIRNMDTIPTWASGFDPCLTSDETGNVVMLWSTENSWQVNGTDDYIKLYDPENILVDEATAPKDAHKTRQVDGTYVLSDTTTGAIGAPNSIENYSQPVYIYEIGEKGTATRLIDYNSNYVLLYIPK